MAQQVVNSFRQALLVALICAPTLVSGGTSELQARMALAEAKYEEAIDAGFAWRANRLALEAARKALASGDEQTAEATIEEAIKLADASLAQAAREAKEWDTRFPFAR